ncbi:4-hydroxyphenylacetate 3-hydroxylase N-terminal domain-containing protein [Cupriavidus basilensis]
MVKTGSRHIDMLRDGREVYLDGKRVADVTADPAFRNSIRSCTRTSTTSRPARRTSRR